MKIKNLTKNWLTGALIVIGMLTVPAYTVAQSTNSTSTGNAGDSLKLSPLRNDIVAQPGESRKITMYIQNLTNQPIALKVVNNDFIAGSEENGIPSIVLDENEYAPTHSLKRFMQPIGDIRLAANEQKAVDVTINVPGDAAAGGYFGAVRFVPTAGSADESVNLTGSVASLIILTVPGNLIERLTLKEFSLQQGSSNFGGIVNSPKDIKAVVRLENKGNVQLAPFGVVTVQKGDKVVHEAKINDITPAGLVLPDSIRKWSLELKNLENFGKYKVIATVGYGGSGETITAERTFWVIPLAYILAALGALCILIGIVVAVIMSLRSYKRRILRQARRGRR